MFGYQKYGPVSYTMREVWAEIRAEWPARRRQSVPMRVQLGAIVEPIVAAWQGMEFVGASRGLQWSDQEGWE